MVLVLMKSSNNYVNELRQRLMIWAEQLVRRCAAFGRLLAFRPTRTAAIANASGRRNSSVFRPLCLYFSFTFPTCLSSCLCGAMSVRMCRVSVNM